MHAGLGGDDDEFQRKEDQEVEVGQVVGVQMGMHRNLGHDETVWRAWPKCGVRCLLVRSLYRHPLSSAAGHSRCVSRGGGCPSSVTGSDPSSLHFFSSNPIYSQPSSIHSNVHQLIPHIKHSINMSPQVNLAGHQVGQVGYGLMRMSTH